MSDDKLLEELAARMRQRKKDEPGAAWDRLSAGELDDAAIEALRQAEADGDAPDGAFDAFRPLDDAYRRQLSEQAAARLASGKSTLPGKPPIRFPAQQPAPSRRQRIVPFATAATVLFALGAVIALLPGGAEPIPGYDIALTGASAFRSGPQAGDMPMFRSGDRFELRLTPATAVDGAVSVMLYLEEATGIAELGTPAPEVAPSGAVRIAGTIDSSVFLPVGEATLYAVIARSGAQPTESLLRRTLGDNANAEGDGWQAWRLTVSYTP